MEERNEVAVVTLNAGDLEPYLKFLLANLVHLCNPAATGLRRSETTSKNLTVGQTECVSTGTGENYGKCQNGLILKATLQGRMSPNCLWRQL